MLFFPHNFSVSVLIGVYFRTVDQLPSLLELTKKLCLAINDQPFPISDLYSGVLKRGNYVWLKNCVIHLSMKWFIIRLSSSRSMLRKIFYQYRRRKYLSRTKIIIIPANIETNWAKINLFTVWPKFKSCCFQNNNLLCHPLT